MPLLESTRGRVVAIIVGAALLWMGIQTGMLMAVADLGLASPLTAGLAVLAVIGYWMLDELEDDDDVADAISKTSRRAESASRGFLQGSAALILGGLTVAMTVGMELLDLLGAVVDIVMTAPLAAAQVGTIGAGLGAAVGLLSSAEVLAVGFMLLMLALIARRRDSTRW